MVLAGEKGARVFYYDEAPYGIILRDGMLYTG